ncbi:MAG TPA: hypothetical protein VK592_00230 [Candidatus Dormibacteraeota bacterium]|nr:hypothetical protein [Candidatus Dormibacteraeota bacterium]
MPALATGAPRVGLAPPSPKRRGLALGSTLRLLEPGFELGDLVLKLPDTSGQATGRGAGGVAFGDGDVALGDGDVVLGDGGVTLGDGGVTLPSQLFASGEQGGQKTLDRAVHTQL